MRILLCVFRKENAREKRRNYETYSNLGIEKIIVIINTGIKQ